MTGNFGCRFRFLGLQASRNLLDLEFPMCGPGTLEANNNEGTLTSQILAVLEDAD